MKCAACNSICQTCTNSTSSDCLTCINVTSAGITTVFFKYAGNNSCIQTCPIGTIPNSSINNCDSCQVGCAVCSLNAANCTQCSIVSAVKYFLTLSSNSCVTVCPDDSFGNTTNLLCYCEYFMLNGRCLAKCPSGYVGIVGNVSTCVLCNQTNQSCSSSKFNVQTAVSRNGKQF
jgi:proprotein convertase subtilisin/kexin type 5